MKSTGYAGKITNKGSQYVEAPFTQKGGKKAKINKGGDLRASDKAEGRK